MAVLNEFVKWLYAFLSKNGLSLMKGYVIFVDACPGKSYEFTRMVKAKEFGISKASKVCLCLYYFEYTFIFYGEFIFD